ncbi:MAG: rhomboid family intramembrane serine protease [Isosphaeraceae bacterium]
MYVYWFPHNQVRVLVFRVITLMPALLVIGLWIVMQIFLGMGELRNIGQQGGVAYMAHIGGALAGLVFGFVFRDDARAAGQQFTQFGWAPDPYRNEPGPFWANRR